MAIKWNGPPVPKRNRRAGKLQRFGNLNDPDSTSTDPKSQSAPRIKVCGPLLLGPGGEARNAELRRRKLHLKLVEMRRP